jgi:hypothetical protein
MGSLRCSGKTLRPLQRHNSRRAAFYHSRYMLSPKVQRLAFLLVISRAVVDASDAALVTRDVIDNRFDNMWLHPKLSHAGDNGASQVVHCPMF